MIIHSTHVYRILKKRLTTKPWGGAGAILEMKTIIIVMRSRFNMIQNNKRKHKLVEVNLKRFSLFVTKNVYVRTTYRHFEVFHADGKHGTQYKLLSYG